VPTCTFWTRQRSTPEHPHLTTRSYFRVCLLLGNVMLGIDWIEDIEVQAFCINFLAELKALRAELIAQT